MTKGKGISKRWRNEPYLVMLSALAIFALCVYFMLFLFCDAGKASYLNFEIENQTDKTIRIEWERTNMKSLILNPGEHARLRVRTAGPYLEFKVLDEKLGKELYTDSLKFSDYRYFYQEQSVRAKVGLLGVHFENLSR